MSTMKVPGAHAVVRERTNLHRHTVSGRGATLAEAVAMRNAILAITSGTLEKYFTVDADANAPTILAPTTDFTDIILELSDGTRTRTLRVNNADISLTTAGGGVNIGAQALVDLATAYRDEDNRGSYVLKSGKVVN